MKQPSCSHEETSTSVMGMESEMCDLCFQQVNLLPFRMKLIVKVFLFLFFVFMNAGSLFTARFTGSLSSFHGL